MSSGQTPAERLHAKIGHATAALGAAASGTLQHSRIAANLAKLEAALLEHLPLR